MKKMMLTLVLAIVSSVWTMSEELCSISVPTPEAQNFYAQKGKMDFFPYPCNEGEECPDCMVVGMLIGNDTFYLANLSQNELVNYERYKVWYPMECTTLGALFTYGNRNYIQQCTGNYYFPTGLTEGESITVSGDINRNGWYKLSSCEDNNPCIPGTLLKLRANGAVYYLGTNDSMIGAQLDSIENVITSVNGASAQPATISGTIYTLNGYKYINISNISISEKLTQDKYRSIEWIKSLCNEWNVLEFRSYMGYSPDDYHTTNYLLTTDTFVVFDNHYGYAKLEKDGLYYGAVREGSNKDIYYVPADSTHEYLLYAFNSKIGDEFTNIWIGTMDEFDPVVRKATVIEIKETYPRTFVLDVECAYQNNTEIIHKQVEWIEGIGFTTSPEGGRVTPLAGGFCSSLLCAYEDGRQIYVSELGEQYGCEINSEHTGDTISLFIKDGPGTSTVDPVDPNLIYAILQGELLTIRDFTGVEIYCTLVNTRAPSDSSRRVRVQAQPFRDSLSVELTDAGQYDLVLTSTGWDYTVFGTFTYGILQGIETPLDDQRAATKMLRNGQLILMYKGQMYNVQGQQIQ